MTTSEVEISKSVLLDISLTSLEGIEGAEVAPSSLKMGEVLRQQGPRGAGTRRPKALKVTREHGEVTVDLGLNIEYGQHLLKVAQQVQQAVRENIELMTGLKVRAVNVTVQNVSVPKGPAS